MWDATDVELLFLYEQQTRFNVDKQLGTLILQL